MNPSDGVPALAAAALDATPQTPGRSGFIPVYSRSGARVFLVGGSGASGRDVDVDRLEDLSLVQALGLAQVGQCW